MTKERSFLHHFCRRIAKSDRITVIILTILLLLYIEYSGLHVDPNHPAYSQLWAPQPEDFSTVKDFLQKDETQAFAYNAEYRYMILPSYVQINAYTRYNYPNFIYFGSFSSKVVTEFVTAANELVAEQDTAAIYPLSLASIKHIAILPETFVQDELQGWRLTGETRTSGVHLFGDINEYLAFISGLANTHILYERAISVFVNEKAVPRIYVPSMLMYAQGDLRAVFRDLKVLDSVFSPSNFALVVNQSEWTKSRSFVIEDFSRQMQTKAMIFNLTEQNFKYKSNEETSALDEKSIIVWSQQNLVSTNGDFITINGTVPADQQALSIWIRIPPTTFKDTSMLKIRLLVDTDMLDKIGFLILDQEGTPLEAKIEKTTSLSTDNVIYLDLLIIPKISEPTWLEVFLRGSAGSTLEIALEKWIRFEETIGLELYLDDVLGAINDQEGTMYPIVITNRNNMSVLWPVRSEGGMIEYTVNTPIELNNASILAMSATESDAGWIKVSEEVEWLSPIDMIVDLELSLLSGEGGKEILVPIFFGNEYDPSWNVYPTTNSGRITEIEHVLGNGFGNLWLVRIGEIQNDVTALHLSFKIQMSKIELYLYQLYMLTGLALVLLIVPLHMLWIKRCELP